MLSISWLALSFAQVTVNCSPCCLDVKIRGPTTKRRQDQTNTRNIIYTHAATAQNTRCPKTTCHDRTTMSSHPSTWHCDCTIPLARKQSVHQKSSTDTLALSCQQSKQQARGTTQSMNKVIPTNLSAKTLIMPTVVLNKAQISWKTASAVAN